MQPVQAWVPCNNLNLIDSIDLTGVGASCILHRMLTSIHPPRLPSAPPSDQTSFDAQRCLTGYILTSQVFIGVLSRSTDSSWLLGVQVMENMTCDQKHSAKSSEIEATLDVMTNSMNSSLQSVADDADSEDLALMEGINIF